MLTLADVTLRSWFAMRWNELLREVASGLHFYTHFASEDAAIVKEQVEGAFKAAWHLAEWERDYGPAIGDHFGRLVSRLTPDLAALRIAALAFSATPGETTRGRLLDLVRDLYPTTDTRFYFDASPFADESEHRAWAERRLLKGDEDGPTFPSAATVPHPVLDDLNAVMGLLPDDLPAVSVAADCGRRVLLRGVAVLANGGLAAVLEIQTGDGRRVDLLPIDATQEQAIRDLMGLDS
jgi:hypothetical protein